MTRMLMTTAAVLALAAPSNVWAQGGNGAWNGRAEVRIAAGAQAVSPDFKYDYSTTLFEENARAGLDIPGKPGLSFDLGVGVRLVQNLGVGVTYSRYSRTRDATLSTTIPSPFDWNDSSTVERTMSLQREENAIHIQAIYKVPITSRLQVGAFGGPSYFRCIDDTVTRFQLQGEVSPTLDWNVAFDDVSMTIERDSTWGYHAGADVTYFVTKQIGIGTTVRYSRASHTYENPLSDTSNLYWEGIWGGNDMTTTVTMRHGGLQWNGGVTFRF